MLKIIGNNIGLLLIVFLSCLLSVVLTFFRFFLAHATVYAFLLWNLFLGLIPFVISLIVFRLTQRASFFRMMGLVGLWLLFFPNAPYMVTDLFHYQYVHPVPQGYDMALLISYAWNGLILGHLSLMFIHESIQARFNAILAWIFVFLSLFLGSFGIYLGRFLRWNSWDVLFHPNRLLADIVTIITDPYTHRLPWAIIVLTFVFLMIGYLFIRQLISFGKKQANKNIEYTN